MHCIVIFRNSFIGQIYRESTPRGGSSAGKETREMQKSGK